MAAADPGAVASDIAGVFERLGLRYSIGGSIASGIAGEPRSTLDIDVVVELGPADVDSLIAALEARYYVPTETLRRAARERATASVIHMATSVKVDLFVAGGSALDTSTLERRLAVPAPDGGAALFVHSPEDVLLQKLRWYQMGGGVSDRQWRDVIGIVRVQGLRLDRTYLASGAALLGVADLLASALAQQ